MTEIERAISHINENVAKRQYLNAASWTQVLLGLLLAELSVELKK